MADVRGAGVGGGDDRGRGASPSRRDHAALGLAVSGMADVRGAEVGGGGDRGRGASPSRRDHAALGLAVSGMADGGGGGGRGRGASPSSRDHADAELAEYAHMPIFVGFDNSEAYQGEFEDQEFLSILLSEQEHPPLIQELLGQVTREPAAPAQPDTAPAGALAEDAALNAEVIDDNESFLDIYNADSAENVLTAPIAPEIYAEMTENEATLPNIMAPVEDASTELDDVNVHAIRGSDREDRIVVERDQVNQGNAGDLDSYLHEGQWEHALRLLDHMVAEGKADNGAVEAGAPERDIYKAHPELVLWLRGQTYVDLRKEGCTMAAEVYYSNCIAALYPDGVSTGSSFADSIILGSLHKITRTGSPLRGRRAFVDGKETRQCVQDYLKVYFPGYRLRETDSRVLEFGRREGGIVRCFLCHKEYRGLNLTKLEQHLQRLGHGKQGKCSAVTIYITQRLEQILAAEDVAGSRRRRPRAVVPPPRHLPPPPPPPPPDEPADAAAPSSSSIS